MAGYTENKPITLYVPSVVITHKDRRNGNPYEWSFQLEYQGFQTKQAESCSKGGIVEIRRRGPSSKYDVVSGVTADADDANNVHYEKRNISLDKAAGLVERLLNQRLRCVSRCLSSKMGIVVGLSPISLSPLILAKHS